MRSIGIAFFLGRSRGSQGYVGFPKKMGKPFFLNGYPATQSVGDP
jgi:hypothetical protein